MPSFQNSVSTSPSPIADSEDSLAYYKSQYEQLEAELADFQASSKELEVELEKDVEAAERRERQLQGKVEGLGFEVEEWKVIWPKTTGDGPASRTLSARQIYGSCLTFE